ncbi:MAG: helix-turn-helix transcriptional regulator [Actinobacteria bacterium]|nr:helix-turn-helix transcriptional regulator [Actinomycetota bacterium]
MDESDARLAYVVGRRMRRIRRDQELSQEAVAWMAGIHRTQICFYEHGERMPLLASFVRLAGGLGVSPCVLLDGITWERSESRPGRLVLPDPGVGFASTPEYGAPR